MADCQIRCGERSKKPLGAKRPGPSRKSGRDRGALRFSGQAQQTGRGGNRKADQHPDAGGQQDGDQGPFGAARLLPNGQAGRGAGPVDQGK